MSRRDVLQLGHDTLRSFIHNVVDYFYAIFMSRERQKRYVNHVNDTIDFGYYGLKDAPLEYRIYPIIQDFEHKKSFELLMWGLFSVHRKMDLVISRPWRACCYCRHSQHINLFNITITFIQS